MYFIIFFDVQGEVIDVWRWSTEEEYDYSMVLKQLETSEKIYQHGWF